MRNILYQWVTIVTPAIYPSLARHLQIWTFLRKMTLKYMVIDRKTIGGVRYLVCGTSLSTLYSLCNVVTRTPPFNLSGLYQTMIVCTYVGIV